MIKMNITIRNVALLLPLFALLLFSSCSENNNMIDDEITNDEQTTYTITDISINEESNNSIYNIESTYEQTSFESNKTATLKRYTDDSKYGFVNENDEIIVPAIYDSLTQFDCDEKTGVSGCIDNKLYFIDRSGIVFEQVEFIPIHYTDYYNGISYRDNAFWDEQGHELYRSEFDLDFVNYWGNGYFESCFYPTYNGISFQGHSFFVDATGNEKLCSADIYVTDLKNGYAIVNGERWSALIDSNLNVKTIFYNTITCGFNGDFVPNLLTDLSFSKDESGIYLKVRKGYQPLTANQNTDVQLAVKSLFNEQYNQSSVNEFCYIDKYDLLERDDYYLIEDDFDYELININDISSCQINN